MAEQKIYDVLFIGAGPGGYVAAIRARQLGLSVAVVEKDFVGGTCLNRGCIPSKVFLRSAELYRNALAGESYGVIAQKVSVDFEKVKERKRDVVAQLGRGIDFLFKKNKIDYYSGHGMIAGDASGVKFIKVLSADGKSSVLRSKNVVIATGSRPRMLANIKVDGKKILTTDEAFEMAELPASIVIIGGGVIGMEWASLLNDFGVEVTIVEYLDRILPSEDIEISKELTRVMKKRKIKIITGGKVLAESIKLNDDSVSLTIERKEKQEELITERILVAVGREAVTENLGLESTAVELDRGTIKVNDFYQTADPKIYAIGDCIGGLQLAHVASSEGVAAVEHIAGNSAEQVDDRLVPKCTFTFPEVASIGLTAEQAKEQGYSTEIGKFNFRGVGKALVHGESDGFVKLVIDETTEKILGVHMIGPQVTDLIMVLGITKQLESKVSEISAAIYPHPTLSESIAEAVLNIKNRQIHS